MTTKRILIAGFQQETGSFNPKPTVYDDFDVLSGQAIPYKRCPKPIFPLDEGVEPGF